jgi:hypothetical protein
MYNLVYHVLTQKLLQNYLVKKGTATHDIMYFDYMTNDTCLLQHVAYYDMSPTTTMTKEMYIDQWHVVYFDMYMSDSKIFYLD